MSALGQKRTFAAQNGMSALPQKRTCAVQYVMSAKCQKRTHAPQQTKSLFEDFVGAREQRNGYLYPDRFCGLEIYH